MPNKNFKELWDKVNQFEISDDTDIIELITSLKRTGFNAKRLAIACEIYRDMISDKDCVKFFGLAGALVPAGMQRILHDFIKEGFIDTIAIAPECQDKRGRPLRPGAPTFWGVPLAGGTPPARRPEPTGRPPPQPATRSQCNPRRESSSLSQDVSPWLVVDATSVAIWSIGLPRVFSHRKCARTRLLPATARNGNMEQPRP